MGNVERLIQHLRTHYNLTRDNRTRSIFRHDSDSNSMSWLFDESADSATCCDHGDSDKGYGLRAIFEQLGLELEVKTVGSTKRAYISLEDYAKAHYVGVDVFKAAGWQEGTNSYQGKIRPCYIFPVNGQKRYRYTDGEEPRFTSQYGFKACWYGLDRAIAIAEKFGLDHLIIVNGEPSVVVGQHYNAPAFGQSGGERGITPENLAELRRKWQGKILIALDCDDKGRKASAKMLEQIPDAEAKDMRLSLNGDFADWCGLHQQEAYSALVQCPNLFQQQQRLPETTRPKLISSRDVAKNAANHLTQVIGGIPIPNPFRMLAAFLGYAAVFWAGKLTLVQGASGHGKTAFLECLVDAFLKRGLHGIWYGSEFSPEEYHMRRIQRYAKIITIDDMMNYELHKWEVMNDIPYDERRGRELSEAQEVAYLEWSEKIGQWRGSLWYVPQTQYIEEILALMGEEIQESRRGGNPISFVVLDYAQLLEPIKADQDKVNKVIKMVKEFAIINNVHVIVGSQVTKASSRAMQQENILLDAAAAQNLREDAFNLVLALNPVYVETGEIDKRGKPVKVMSNQGVISVLKNSAGRKGDARVKTDFSRLAWLDEGW